MLTELTAADFQASVLEEKELPVLVDFFSPTCGPCQAMMPTLRYLAEDKLLGKVKVFKVNVDMNMGVADEYGIRKLPTLVFFQDGVEITRIFGAKRSSEIISTLEDSGLCARSG